MSQEPTPPSDDVAIAPQPGSTADNAAASADVAAAAPGPDDAADAAFEPPAGAVEGDSASPVTAPLAAAGDATAAGDHDAGPPATSAGTEPFSQLLEVRPPPAPKALTSGQRVRGTILAIGDEQTIVTLSGRPDAVLATRELRSPDGTLLLRVDDPLSAIVQTVDIPVVLTLGKKRGLLNAAKLRIAHEQKRPVNGIIRAVNKGGFEVRVQGVRGFCPLSQIDFGMTLEPQSYVGLNCQFRVLRWENGGRNIVLSRRAILKEEAEHKAVETRTKLAVGSEFDGVVKRVQPFGAFVDIGGVEGLLHVSRIGHGGVADPAQVLSPGQEVHVRVTRIDNPGTGKERIALAAPSLGPDPWETALDTLREGETVHGRVVRLAEFGAFVNLTPGIDGLVHLSELPRSENADKPPVQPGDEVEVRILRVDLEKKRVSLSMRPLPAARPPAREPRRPRRERERDRDRDRDRDAAPHSTGGSLTHTMAEQLGALRRKLQVRP
jgi:small subunit ribosomal protein S1